LWASVFRHAARASAVAEIDIRCGDALELLAYINDPVDMVFIDADKPGYVKYLDWVANNVLRGGLMSTITRPCLGRHARRTWVESSMISIMDGFNHRLMEIRRWHPMRYSQNRKVWTKMTHRSITTCAEVIPTP